MPDSQDPSGSKGTTPGTGEGYWKVVLPLLCVFFATCAPYPVSRDLPLETSKVIEGVPLYPLEAHRCGPASLASVLNYWGAAVSPEEVSAAIYSDSAKGTLNVDMVLYTQSRGLRAEQIRGSIKKIQQAIDAGIPPIVLVDHGFWVYQRNHYMVVVGYGEGGLIVNSEAGKQRLIGYEEFRRWWKRANFWTLLVSPNT